MELSKRTKYILIGLLVIFNIILRLPVTPHEIGVDSFEMHAWASSISANGYAVWILHPLSFFGLYPFSYSSGELFLLSGLSQCSGVDMEWTIWIAATFFGVFGIFTAYLMAKEIRNDFLFAFSVAFVYSTAPKFIGFTNWSVSTRGLFVTLLPLLIWVLLRSYNQKEDRLKYLLLTVCLLVILATIHQIIFFTPIILIAFVVSVLFYTANKKFKVPKITPKVSVILFFALFITLFLLPFTPLGFYQRLESFEGGHRFGYFFHGSAPYHILLNMGAEYAMAVGILNILIPIGVFSLLFIKQKTFGEVFLVALILCFAPVLADPVYMRFFVLFIFSLLIGFGLLGIQKMLGKVKKVKSAAPLIIIAILAFSALLPYFVVVRPVSSLPFHTSHMNELTYNAALFIKAYGVEIPRISSSYIPERINAIAGPPYYHEDIDKWSSRIRLSIQNFLKGRGKYDYLYRLEMEWYERFGWSGDCDSDRTKHALDCKTHLVIEDNYRPNNSPFHQSLHETRPKIYDNGLESIWYLSYPAMATNEVEK
jgi:hypothetical protein